MMRDKQIGQWGLFLIALIMILALASLVSFCVGSAGISAIEIPGIFIRGQGSVAYSILMDIRLPRILLGISIGGALSLAGVILQGMFKNPLVEPYTLGISGGASLGVCINILFQFYAKVGIIAYPVSGFLGAGIVIFLVYSLNSRSTHLRSNRMLLTGVMISYVASSLVMLMMALAKTDDLHSIVMWIMGSLDEPDLRLVKIACYGSITGLVLSYWFCLDLNALLLGDEEASSLGLNLAATKRALFIIASFLTGISVSVAGIIMFTGLIVPHFIRMFTGPDHRILLIASYLAGAVFLVICDVIARVIISPLELPVGVISGIIGGVVFIWVLAKKRVRL